jgi:hypothetical protein
MNGNTIADWDNDYRFYMSGVNGNDGNACCPTFYSVRTYNTASNTYSNVTSTATTITRARGYMVWMADNNTQLTAPLVYDNRGTPNFGNITFNVTAGGAGGGYNLVSNPYPCPINFASVVAASGNLQSNFLILQENGSYVTNPNGGTIAPSQGYMVVATSTGNMAYTEACKAPGANPNIIRQADPANYLRITAGNDVNGLGGEAVVCIKDDAHNGFDLAYDMPYLASVYETATNIWTSDAENKNNLLNALDASQDVLEIPLTVKAGVAGNQLIAFRGLSSFGAYSCATLVNVKTGEIVNLRNQDTYSFVAEQAGEEHSFILRFDRTGTCPLDQQDISASLDAQTKVFVSGTQLMTQFYFEETTDVQVTVFDAQGREVSAPKDFSVTKEAVALENPGAHGIYFVRISQGENLVTKKIYY